MLSSVIWFVTSIKQQKIWQQLVSLFCFSQFKFWTDPNEFHFCYQIICHFSQSNYFKQSDPKGLHSFLRFLCANCKEKKKALVTGQVNNWHSGTATEKRTGCVLGRKGLHRPDVHPAQHYWAVHRIAEAHIHQLKFQEVFNSLHWVGLWRIL